MTADYFFVMTVRIRTTPTLTKAVPDGRAANQYGSLLTVRQMLEVYSALQMKRYY